MTSASTSRPVSAGKLSSRILPAYARRSPKDNDVLPVLYLRGLSTGDFRPALQQLLGETPPGCPPSRTADGTRRPLISHAQHRRRSDDLDVRDGGVGAPQRCAAAGARPRVHRAQAQRDGHRRRDPRALLEPSCPYKLPRSSAFVDDLPKTSTGKIMRRELHTLDAVTQAPVGDSTVAPAYKIRPASRRHAM
jgi:hypothetical protein